MAFSSKTSIRGLAVIALIASLPVGLAQAQSYQNLGSYEDWAAQFGVQISPAAPAYAPPVYAPPVYAPVPTYRPPQTIYIEPPRYVQPRHSPSLPYFDGGNGDTILYDRTGRIIGTRDPSGRARYSSPPIAEPGNNDFNFQRDGRGRDGWREDHRYRGDIVGFDEDGNLIGARHNQNRGFIFEPGNDDYDSRRDGRGRGQNDDDSIYMRDDDGATIGIDQRQNTGVIPEPGNDDIGQQGQRQRQGNRPRRNRQNNNNQRAIEPGFETEG